MGQGQVSTDNCGCPPAPAAGRQAGRGGGKTVDSVACTCTYLSGGARRPRFLHDARHRGAGPSRTGVAPVFGLAFAPGREDGRPERVLEGERGWGERCAARDRQLVWRC